MTKMTHKSPEMALISPVMPFEKEQPGLYGKSNLSGSLATKNWNTIDFCNSSFLVRFSNLFVGVYLL